MARNDRKTKPTDADVEAFLAGVEPPARQADARGALALMGEVTGAVPQMWGTSMIGFGRQPYTTSDGVEREWFAVGLAPRTSALTLYGLTYYGSQADLRERLGPHTTGKGCLYIKRLDDVDTDVLTELIRQAWAENYHPPADAAP